MRSRCRKQLIHSRTYNQSRWLFFKPLVTVMPRVHYLQLSQPLNAADLCQVYIVTAKILSYMHIAMLMQNQLTKPKTRACTGTCVILLLSIHSQIFQAGRRILKFLLACRKRQVSLLSTVGTEYLLQNSRIIPGFKGYTKDKGERLYHHIDGKAFTLNEESLRVCFRFSFYGCYFCFFLCGSSSKKGWKCHL